ncbi:MAG: cell division protein ZipA [Salinicola sp.]|uniref:cell division protein ZipA n=1 Tax=Salinicola sp. TaxID=1978524 RepID=UPI000C946928|nr:cell division protein ZipA [Salinicola sp.]MAM58606.1 cell division protein ZipA [Salinicola sp.]NRB54635.1 cell division protein ZipA [Salinicola sp.]
MELREWLIILGLVLVATIVIDGFRRLQRQRRVPRLDRAIGDNGVDDGSEVDPEQAAREAEVNWELPNGGARVLRPATFERSGNGSEPIRPAEPKRQERIPEEKLQSSILDRGPRSSFADMQHNVTNNVKSAVRAGAKRVSESAQRLSHRREDAKREAEESRARASERHEEPHLGTREVADAEAPGRLQITTLVPPDEGHVADAGARMADQQEVTQQQDRSRTASRAESELASRSSAPMEETEDAPRSDVVTQHPAVERAKRHHVSAARARETLAHSEEIIVISVLARTEAGFDGTTLLNLMLACGLRFSEMGIFHRYETESDDSELQFSMVNVLKPGVFDLDKMHEIVTPGVTFLMPLPGANDTAAAFEAMLETAMVLVRNLGGELKDENHSVMTAQTIEFARQRVQEFERRHRLHRYQAN